MAVLTTALAAPALADDELARSPGVEPGLHSTADLILMREARRDNDDLCFDTIAAHAPPADEFAPALGARGRIGGACRAKLARSLGVDPSQYSTAELGLMRVARREGDELCHDTVASRTGEQLPTRARDDACKAPPAAAMPMDADDFSFVERSAMVLEAHGSDGGRATRLTKGGQSDGRASGRRNRALAGPGARLRTGPTPRGTSVPGSYPGAAAPVIVLDAAGDLALLAADQRPWGRGR
jgi:hypothetical protein